MFDSETTVQLLVCIFVTAGLYITWLLVRHVRAKRESGHPITPRPIVLGISSAATFLDTLGIGSFAPTTSAFRQWRLVPDEHMPGTLNVGYVIPTLLVAAIYIQSISVDATTLIAMLVASVIGAWFGAGIVSHWPRRRIRIGMGIALLVAGLIMLLSQPQIALLPSGGEATGLHGLKLVVGVIGNFVLGALMTLGIGLYAPCMILVYFLGLSPAAAFPIMMGSCALLMPVASVRFLKAGSFSSGAVVGMALTGIPAVLVAALLVKSLPLVGLKWLVIVIVTYTAIALLRSARFKLSKEVAL
uniref:Probable membrane transporter protein n=1 Tax=Candidatus Kentrum sp. MB TaxID=2138164 RepID=A0A450XMH4_9GAMM|nr:MAG: Uncharacterized membrane protein YfcA [Candidatus Kentron sp. MB]VFK34419.1 MAG: Uncharacterized membrane protein YfcA [Candidatus Kentron sp. MB]VFK76704.1 MAG: Uncharacterized membrane protein YfcA [Candidatus Kentron sp. MB]